jgi:hypothetical protein
MTKRMQKGAAALLALGALGFGGSAVAGAASTAEPVGGPDTDTVQSGDQTTPDVGTTAKATKSSATPAATPSQSSATPAAGEQPGVESSTEAPGTESSSETAAGNDGPGGHADEPGNPQANNQFQGQQ